ncbi:hypothetical protein H310_00155 [Aphanomyces invadans]|uniref:EF-hand domain-containing protein n=1 Tax=Aphanomyces invadans TaxID=157072 RepID=A0A024UVD6_9STRA|nr:hypothetical protein H310_00155 [Aphanomyces invadans]ETW09623.1 hypothetical protein H310_00155 [Aphanomyces invadans]|eukprot:XP_008861034.1 hypothetical protein H310_00155 [Aphanomyces invadans]
MGSPAGTDAVGWRVQVLWEEEDAWFEGIVTEYDDEKGYYVCYDDGDEKWQATQDPGAMKFLSNTLGQSVEARVSSVVTPPATARQDDPRNGEEAVGWRVQVFWADEGTWFDGVVTEYDPSKGYFVCYDDGETKWQASNDRATMVFVSTGVPIPKTTLLEAALEPSTNDPPSATKTDYCNDESEHHGDDDGGEDTALLGHEETTIETPRAGHQLSQKEDKPSTPIEDGDADVLSTDNFTSVALMPQVSAPVSSTQDKDNTIQLKQQQEPCSKSVSSKAWKPRKKPVIFFHDKEALVEMKAQLIARKNALDDNRRQLLLKVTLAENAEAAQKQEVADLTANLTVAQLKTTRRVAPPRPQSTEERSLDLTVRTRQLKKDNAQLRQTIVEATKRVEAMQGKLNKARAEWNALPAQCRLTLGDIESQIALLQVEKEALTEELRQRRELTTDPANTQYEGVALKQQLADSDTRMWQLKSELHQWKGLCEQERTKVDAMQARLTALKAEMTPMRSSRILLRSAFDRCDKDKSGELTVDETVQMLLLLAPPEGDVCEDDIRSHFAQSDMNHDSRIDFAEFCNAVERLFNPE